MAEPVGVSIMHVVLSDKPEEVVVVQVTEDQRYDTASLTNRVKEVLYNPEERIRLEGEGKSLYLVYNGENLECFPSPEMFKGVPQIFAVWLDHMPTSEEISRLR